MNCENCGNPVVFGKSGLGTCCERVYEAGYGLLDNLIVDYPERGQTFLSKYLIVEVGEGYIVLYNKVRIPIDVLKWKKGTWIRK